MFYSRLLYIMTTYVFKLVKEQNNPYVLNGRSPLIIVMQFIDLSVSKLFIKFATSKLKHCKDIDFFEI